MCFDRMCAQGEKKEKTMCVVLLRSCDAFFRHGQNDYVVTIFQASSTAISTTTTFSSRQPTVQHRHRRHPKEVSAAYWISEMPQNLFFW